MELYEIISIIVVIIIGIWGTVISDFSNLAKLFITILCVIIVIVIAVPNKNIIEEKEKIVYVEVTAVPDEDSNTLTTISENESTEETSVLLTSIDMMHSDQMSIETHSNLTFNTGEETGDFIYPSRVTIADLNWCEAQYYLQGEYSRLTGWLGITKYDYPIVHSAYIEIYADDKLVYNYNGLSGKEVPVFIDVNIKDCEILLIRMAGASKTTVFANPTVYK